MVYAGLAGAWRQHMPKEFNEIVAIYRDQWRRASPRSHQVQRRDDLQLSQPFYTAMGLYVVTFSSPSFPGSNGRHAWPQRVLAARSRLRPDDRRDPCAHVARSAPPVTNLYSSALFVGWVAVVLCIVLESIYKNAIGSAAGGLIGFGTLVIAHHLALGGDTMEMMRAVLDNNFWLATHVVTVTVGYGATYLAGFLALVYIFRGVFTKSLDRATADSLDRMVYGIVCSPRSLVSWGRCSAASGGPIVGPLLGWDPKENGALIIVL